MKLSYVFWATSCLLIVIGFTFAASDGDLLSSLLGGSLSWFFAIFFFQWGVYVRRGNKRKSQQNYTGATRQYETHLRLQQSLVQSSNVSRMTPKETTLGSVYLLKAGPFYKIGKSVNVEKRLKQIRLQLPYPVEIVHVISTPEYSSLERYWHQKFRSKRTNGEWFILTDEDVREFKNYAH